MSQNELKLPITSQNYLKQAKKTHNDPVGDLNWPKRKSELTLNDPKEDLNWPKLTQNDRKQHKRRLKLTQNDQNQTKMIQT